MNEEDAIAMLSDPAIGPTARVVAMRVVQEAARRRSRHAFNAGLAEAIEQLGRMERPARRALQERYLRIMSGRLASAAGGEGTTGVMAVDAVRALGVFDCRKFLDDHVTRGWKP